MPQDIDSKRIEFIKKTLKERGIKFEQAEIVKVFNLTKGTVSKMFNGIVGVSDNFFETFCKHYNVAMAVDEEKENEIEKIRRRKIFDNAPKGIIAVPIKAQANYSKYFDDVVFQNQLERIYIPNSPYDGDSFRFFQVEGDSMEYIDENTGRVSGIEDGAWIIAEKVPMEDWKDNLRKYYVHVIVTSTRITVKRILQDNRDEIVLHADNDIYGQERLPLNDVKEIWIFKRKLDWNAPPPRRIEIKI